MPKLCCQSQPETLRVSRGHRPAGRPAPPSASSATYRCDDIQALKFPSWINLISKVTLGSVRSWRNVEIWRFLISLWRYRSPKRSNLTVIWSQRQGLSIGVWIFTILLFSNFDEIWPFLTSLWRHRSLENFEKNHLDSQWGGLSNGVWVVPLRLLVPEISWGGVFRPPHRRAFGGRPHRRAG